MYYTSIELENNTLNLKKALNCCPLLGLPTAVTLQKAWKGLCFYLGQPSRDYGPTFGRHTSRSLTDYRHFHHCPHHRH